MWDNGREKGLRRVHGRTWVLSLIALLLLGGVALWLGEAARPSSSASSEKTDSRQDSLPAASTAEGPARMEALAGAPVARMAPGDLGSLADSLARLPRSESEAFLQAWWARRLAEHSASELAAELRVFLESGADLNTGLAFRVGPGGILDSAPSLRVQALDWWGAVDPAGAADYAREIFAASPVPDEWALALRNYGRLVEDPSQDPYYTDRVRELITRSEWQTAPTRGYLEAFDAAVHSGAASIVRGGILDEETLAGILTR